jgi:hypothetical protein
MERDRLAMLRVLQKKNNTCKIVIVKSLGKRNIRRVGVDGRRGIRRLGIVCIA